MERLTEKQLHILRQKLCGMKNRCYNPQNAFAERVRRGWSEDKLLDPKYKPLKMTKSEMSKEIRMYRKLEEQGLLLRVPCGIGADVYFIPSETNFKLNILNDKPQFNRVYHQNVARITFIRNGWYMECDKDLQYATGNILVDKMYKETWFLSQAEAEQQLNVMESDLYDD